VYDRNEYRKALDRYHRCDYHPNINKVVDLVVGPKKAYCFLYPGVAMKASNDNNTSKTTGA